MDRVLAPWPRSGHLKWKIKDPGRGDIAGIRCRHNTQREANYDKNSTISSHLYLRSLTDRANTATLKTEYVSPHGGIVFRGPGSMVITPYVENAPRSRSRLIVCVWTAVIFATECQCNTNCLTQCRCSRAGTQ